MANSSDPDEAARYSHLDLHCLHRYLFWSAGLKGLTAYHAFPKVWTIPFDYL